MKKPTPFGKYYLLERINVGGMAEVFRAKAFGVEGFERLVAVKRILPNIAEDKEFIRMFIEEAKLSVQLNHANIAQIFDLGVVDGSYYIALEHVHGRDLRGMFDRCRAVGEPMPVAQACFVVMKVCEGLDYAHNKRDQSGRELSLVHRDVSPQNVLVSFEGEVKLIDFGIAKAAGKGSKTQAGILKGKFGYMSPEQVRGLPVDRRSDVFSAGIVLYELLTGERLFVGESDFSTLEKVRNVEILPPSTYNRRIPDELERIVLKALAKDVDERYQNAIDLHDELQAFVYTAGEFYSRKDLAGWMKKTFGKEIEEETAKLESYRQLRPPPNEPPAVARAASSSRPPLHTPPPRRASITGAAGTRPPPPPTRVSQQMPTVPAPKAKRVGGGDDDLAWDDDELETQIYDNPEDDPKNQDPNLRRTSKPLPLQPPPAPAPTTSPPPLAAKPDAPDLSKLLGSTSMGWEGGPAAAAASSPLPAPVPVPPGPSPASTLNGIGSLAPNGAPKLASGSNGASATLDPAAVAPIPSLSAPPLLFDPAPSTATPAFDPMASFGHGVVHKKRGSNRGVLWIVAGAAAVAAIAVTAVIVLGGDDAPATPEQPAVVADEKTGFDLYVQPSGLTQWKLDGASRTERLPSSIRGVAPGVHTVQIDPPPGFMSQSQQVTVEPGKVARLDVELKPIPGLTGVFESTPPGATVSLIIDGQRQPPLGEAPQRAPLDPRKSYQVLFEKPGYVSVNRPISFTGALEEKLVVPLEKAGATVALDTTKPDPKPELPKPEPKPDPKPDPKPRTDKIVRTDGRIPDRRPDPKPDPKLVQDPKPLPDPTPPPPKPEVKPDPPKKGNGVLSLGSKPPCQIYVDGVATGLHTPQPRLKLPAGRHRITLINNEFGINEKFSVEIKADATEKVLKDYSDRLPK